MNNDALSECWTNLVDEADPSFVSGLDPAAPWPPCQEKFGWVWGWVWGWGWDGAEELRTTDLHPTSIWGLGQICKQQILLFLLSLFLRTTGEEKIKIIYQKG